MHVLAIDTSTTAMTAGLVELLGSGVRVLDERGADTTRAHAERLGPLVGELIAGSGAPQAIVCGAGPGAFTGLRVGMVTAAALGHALDVPVYPVCGLDAIAARAGTGQRLLVATDARRREWYWAMYDNRGRRVAGPEVAAPDEVRRIAEEDGQTRVLGDGVFGEPVAVDAAGLVTVAAAALRAGAEPAALTPLYLRRPDAKVPAARKRVTQ